MQLRNTHLCAFFNCAACNILCTLKACIKQRSALGWDDDVKLNDHRSLCHQDSLFPSFIFRQLFNMFVKLHKLWLQFFMYSTPTKVKPFCLVLPYWLQWIHSISSSLSGRTTSPVIPWVDMEDSLSLFSPYLLKVVWFVDPYHHQIFRVFSNSMLPRNACWELAK